MEKIQNLINNISYSNEINEEEIFVQLEEALVDYRGYVTHWEIYVPAIKNFFYDAKKVLSEVGFANREVLHLLAKSIVTFCERKGLASCDEYFAEMMESLGFFKDAFYLYNSAKREFEHNGNLRKKMQDFQLNVIKKYRERVEKDEDMENIIEREARDWVSWACRVAIDEIFNPPKFTPWNQWYAQGQKHLAWDHSIDVAKKSLEKMGLNEAEIEGFFRPAHEAIVKALIKNRDEEARPGDTWWDIQLKKYEVKGGE